MRKNEITRLARDAYCPFFKGITKTRIKCEGPYKGMSVYLLPGRNERMLKHYERYCSKKECEGCRIYRAAMEKYDEES